MTQSNTLFERAQQVIPGGVNSPVRAFGAVGGTPPFIVGGKGAYLHDANGKHYIDYVQAWGPLILGHSEPSVVEAVQAQAAKGLGFGAPTELEVELAEQICNIVPSIEQVRLVNSGTEATMTAIRLARGHTGRDKILKFAGCYHGHADCLLVNAGSGALTFGVPSSPGVPEDFAKHTLNATYNDLASVEALFKAHPDDIACIILEPVAGNMNCVPPTQGFLQGLRDLCDQYGALLIFDEVMTGFRVALGGAQAHFNITPDLTCLGKVIGGGQPVGAFGGRKDLMQQISPCGPVYQAGTMSGNPIAVTAGLASLKQITQAGFYDKLTQKVQRLTQGLEAAAKDAGIPFMTQSVGTMFGLFFTSADSVTNLDESKQCDAEQFNRFFHLMLDAGVYLAPSAFEAGFMSAAHSDADIDQTIAAAQVAFAALAKDA